MSVALEGTAPKGPLTPLPWIGAIFVAILGIAQQFCLIGKALTTRNKKDRRYFYLKREQRDRQNRPHRQIKEKDKIDKMDKINEIDKIDKMDKTDKIK